MYSIAELATARQYDLPVTWLIVDDGGYGILREYMTDAFGEATATELSRPDFVALAESFGVPGVRTTPETLEADLAKALAAPGPSVVVLPPCCGWWGKRRASNSSEYLVAGRRLGGFLYTSTMAAVVIGGASTVGGVGLGYKYGISGMWLVVSIAPGVLLLSLLFAARIQRLKVYTVSGMLKLRYGIDATGTSGLVMMAYTLMLTVTSTIAYATIFNVLFGFDRTLSVVLGGLIVVAYSAMGGMWSITLTDVVQFVIKTIGVFVLLLPFTWSKAGGYAGIKERVGEQATRARHGIGTGTIITFFVVYTLGILIGQDIWQRVFTAKSPEVARWGGVTAGVYCLLYGVAGALIGGRVGPHARHRFVRRRVRRRRRPRSCPSVSAASSSPPRWPR